MLRNKRPTDRRGEIRRTIRTDADRQISERDVERRAVAGSQQGEVAQNSQVNMERGAGCGHRDAAIEDLYRFIELAARVVQLAHQRQSSGVVSTRKQKRCRAIRRKAPFVVISAVIGQKQSQSRSDGSLWISHAGFRMCIAAQIGNVHHDIPKTGW